MTLEALEQSLGRLFPEPLVKTTQIKIGERLVALRIDRQKLAIKSQDLQPDETRQDSVKQHPTINLGRIIRAVHGEIGEKICSHQILV
jgi:hypothetical protein